MSTLKERMYQAQKRNGGWLRSLYARPRPILEYCIHREELYFTNMRELEPESAAYMRCALDGPEPALKTYDAHGRESEAGRHFCLYSDPPAGRYLANYAHGLVEEEHPHPAPFLNNYFLYHERAMQRAIDGAAWLDEQKLIPNPHRTCRDKWALLEQYGFTPTPARFDSSLAWLNPMAEEKNERRTWGVQDIFPILVHLGLVEHPDDRGLGDNQLSSFVRDRATDDGPVPMFRFPVYFCYEVRHADGDEMRKRPMRESEQLVYEGPINFMEGE